MIPGEIAGDRRKTADWLKGRHGVGHYQAVTIFEVSPGSGEYDDHAGTEKESSGEPDGELLAHTVRAALIRVYQENSWARAHKPAAAHRLTVCR